MNPETEDYRPIGRRRRWLIIVLALATAVFVAWAVTRKAGLVRQARSQPADVANCTAGQTEGCVGSRTLILAAPPAASR